MQRAEDFQTPVSTPEVAQEGYANEWATHYGILVGGMRELAWDGIGESSIGHHRIVRRIWMPFIKLQVGRRNEFDGALDMPENTVVADWSTNPDRLRWKSPRACAQDVLSSFKPQGYCVPMSLIGNPQAEDLAERVWPRDVRDRLRLFEQVQYFESFSSDDKAEATLAAELLGACYTALGSAQEYVRLLKTEVEGEKGLRNLNEALKELFYEIGEPLPEQKTALVAQAMGREIVQAVQPDGRKDDAVISVLGKIVDRLDRMEERFGQGGDPERGEASVVSTETSAQTSNTSTRRRAEAEAGRRHKDKE